MPGIEYILLHVQGPILYVIRKQHRHSPTDVTPIADYYIIAGTVYQAPDLASVFNSRLVSHLGSVLTRELSFSLIFRRYFFSFPLLIIYKEHSKKLVRIPDTIRTKDILGTFHQTKLVRLPRNVFFRLIRFILFQFYYFSDRKNKISNQKRYWQSERRAKFTIPEATGRSTAKWITTKVSITDAATASTAKC